MNEKREWLQCLEADARRGEHGTNRHRLLKRICLNDRRERDLASRSGCLVDEDQAMRGEDEEGRLEREERRGAIGVVGFEMDAGEETAFDLAGKKDRAT